MNDSLNEAQCLKIIEAKSVNIQPPKANHSLFLSKKEKASYIQKIYKVWKQNQS